MNKRRKPAVPVVDELPTSHLIALHAAGLAEHSFLDKAIKVRTPQGEVRHEWLPSLCIGIAEPAGRTRRVPLFNVIEWRPKEHPHNGYGKDGWFPSQGHSNGGFCETITQAISWFKQLEDQKNRQQ